MFKNRVMSRQKFSKGLKRQIAIATTFGVSSYMGV